MEWRFTGGLVHSPSTLVVRRGISMRPESATAPKYDGAGCQPRRPDRNGQGKRTVAPAWRSSRGQSAIPLPAHPARASEQRRSRRAEERTRPPSGFAAERSCSSVQPARSAQSIVPDLDPPRLQLWCNRHGASAVDSGGDVELLPQERYGTAAPGAQAMVRPAARFTVAAPERQQQ